MDNQHIARLGSGKGVLLCADTSAITHHALLVAAAGAVFVRSTSCSPANSGRPMAATAAKKQSMST